MSTSRPIPDDSVTPRSVVIALVAITLLGVVVRIYGIGTDLWMDEIATLSDSRGHTAWQLLTVFPSSNQHVLNSILINWSIGLFGEHEWSVHLPAMVFGSLSVPAMYWFARSCRFTRALSLGAAALLALSFHYIEFSQNARGYTGYVLFSLVATASLVGLLERPRRGLAFVYVCAMGLDFLAMLFSAFLFASHVIASALFLYIAKRNGERVPGRTRMVAIALGASALLAILIFLPLAAVIFRSLNGTYTTAPTGFAPLSFAFVRETFIGIAAGLGGGLLLAAAPVVILGAVGLWRLFRRAWVPVTVIILSQVMFVGTCVVLHWQVYPRYGILVLPLGLLAVLSSFELLGLAAERWGPASLATAGQTIAVALVCLLSAAFVAALPRYYRTPKQPNRAATEDIGRRIGANGVAVAVGTGDAGFNYYAPRLGLPAGRALSTRTVAGFDSITARFPKKDIYIVTSFQRAFEIERPELAAAVKAGWVRARVFPASVRGAEMIVWEPKP